MRVTQDEFYKRVAKKCGCPNYVAANYVRVSVKCACSHFLRFTAAEKPIIIFVKVGGYYDKSRDKRSNYKCRYKSTTI